MRRLGGFFFRLVSTGVRTERGARCE